MNKDTEPAYTVASMATALDRMTDQRDNWRAQCESLREQMNDYRTKYFAALDREAELRKPLDHNDIKRLCGCAEGWDGRPLRGHPDYKP